MNDILPKFFILHSNGNQMNDKLGNGVEKERYLCFSSSDRKIDDHNEQYKYRPPTLRHIFKISSPVSEASARHDRR